MLSYVMVVAVASHSPQTSRNMLCRRPRVRRAVKTTRRSKQKRFPPEIGEGTLQGLSNLMGCESCCLEANRLSLKGRGDREEKMEIVSHQRPMLYITAVL